MSVKLYHNEEEEEEEEEIEEEGKKKQFKPLSNLRSYRYRCTSQQGKKKYSIKKRQLKTRRYKRKKKAVKRYN